MARPKSLRKITPSLWRILRHFWPHVRRQRVLAMGSLVALCAEIGLRLLEPWPLKLIFDHVILTAPHGHRPELPFIGSPDTHTLLIVSVVALVIIVGLRATVSFANTVGFALVGNRVLTDVRGQLYRHLQALSLSYHTKAKQGDLVVRVIGDVGLLKEVTVTAVLPLVANLLILLGMVVVMFVLNWQLAMVAMAVVPLFWISTTRLSRRIGQAARKQRKREGAMAATAAESISAIKTVQALSLEDNFARLFTSQNKKSLKDGVKAKRLAATLKRTVEVLIAISTAMVLWHGARLVLRQTMTPGDLLVFLAYLKSAFRPVQNFAKYTGRLAKASAAGERVLDVLEQVPDVCDLPGARRAEPFQGEVCFEGVRFAYEGNDPVLNNVSFTIPPRTRVAVVGPSGIGKSTLIGLILRLYDPQDGRVTIDGRDIRHYTLESLRSQISVVLQDTLLFAASVQENIAYTRSDATIDDIRAACRLANADGFINHMPQGYDTVVGERGVTLSGGQRQRIAIARAALRRAPILILDEPTAGLDEQSHRTVCEALQRVWAERTTFIISHNLQLSATADLILYLENGHVAESGTHEELLRRNGRYAEAYRRQTTSGPMESRQETLYASSR